MSDYFLRGWAKGSAEGAILGGIAVMIVAATIADSPDLYVLGAVSFIVGLTCRSLIFLRDRRAHHRG